MEAWTDLIDKGESIDVVYLDFSKAFDSVPHQRLIHKLEAYGISGPIRAWIQDFLTERKQRVVVNHNRSPVTSGVPQGSVLGPLLFVIYINDLPDEIEAAVKIFADDTKLYGKASSEEDYTTLQRDVQKLEGWSEKWQLHFNAKKFKTLHLGAGNPRREYFYFYFYDDTQQDP